MNHRTDVMVVGLRGFPGIQGGIETHCENLLPKIVLRGLSVMVALRSPYAAADHPAEWRGVRFLRLWSPRSRAFEAIFHTALCVLVAAIVRPKILHIQGIGPGIVTPLARLLGLKVVITNHGPDYDRQKWGRFAKIVLRLGESWAMRFSNERIVISETIRSIGLRKYGLDSNLIHNGVVLPDLPNTAAALDRFGLAKGRYVLLVSRLVPEKRHLDLLDAFNKAALPEWKLVFVGSADHPDSYSQSIVGLSAQYPHVVATGFQSGTALRELYAHAGIFVLPSSHEGLPIALLEALSYGLPCVASDIPANLEIGLDEGHYFKLGDTDLLAQRLIEFSRREVSPQWKDDLRRWVAKKFSWDTIAAETERVYRNLIVPPLLTRP